MHQCSPLRTKLAILTDKMALIWPLIFQCTSVNAVFLSVLLFNVFKVAMEFGLLTHLAENQTQLAFAPLFYEIGLFNLEMPNLLKINRCLLNL